MISHGILAHFAPFYQICAFLETVCIFCPFRQNVVNANLSKEMVMEKGEIVMEKSLTISLPSLKGPWYRLTDLGHSRCYERGIVSAIL